MRELTMLNGRPSDRARIRLECGACLALRRFTREEHNDSVVRCRECGTRHHEDSLTDANAMVITGP